MMFSAPTILNHFAVSAIMDTKMLKISSADKDKRPILPELASCDDH